MKTVGIVAKINSQLAAVGVRKLAQWLKSKDIAFIVDSHSAQTANLTVPAFSKEDIANQADLIVVLGGDGTIIGIARLIHGRTTPLFGVNLGALGFLAEFTYEEMIPGLEKALSGEFGYEDRMMLESDFYQNGELQESTLALNDIVVHRGSLSQMINVSVEVDGLFVNNYTADGLLVSTPTGSTAYNLSSGGPIVYPSLNSFIINPICPHALTNRPIVIPDSAKVGISLSNDMKGDAQATLDGQVVINVNSSHKIVIRKSKEVARIIQSPYKNYYELLRGKLKWGETIRDNGK